MRVTSRAPLFALLVCGASTSIVAFQPFTLRIAHQQSNSIGIIKGKVSVVPLASKQRVRRALGVKQRSVVHLASSSGLRGGASPSVMDHSQAAISLFQALLTPSTLLSGAIYASMFTLPFNAIDTNVILLEKRVFVLLSGFSLCSSLTVLVAATSSLVMLR